ncbi:protein bric-a-brac 1-like [Hetaerina americana]|uniref:protein bric-a-brac 1-like n=1 Tax=Hetaerina americana TaxID=62018 RepID=UPI003A7F314C
MAANSAMTTRQIFNLRWNNHTNNMLQVFSEQLNNEKLVDVTLSCEGKFLKVHRMVLSACSPYFQKLFIDHNEQNPIIILKGVKFCDLKSVVSFMYCGEIEVAEPEMEGVLAVAETLEIKGLSDVRESYENSHKKSATSEEEDDGGGTQETGSEGGRNGRCQRSPMSKKRKFVEKGLHVNPVVRKDIRFEDKYTPENRRLPKTPDGETRQDCPQDFYVKEEIHDSDGEVTRDKDEDADWNWSRESERPSPPRASSTIVNEVQGSPLEGISGGDDRASASESLPVRNLLPETLNANAVLQSVCKVVDAAGPVTVGSTARKTMVCSQNQCKIPRPPNAFMVFANEWRRKLALVHHGETNKDISVRLGVMWKELPPDAKESYFAAARRADQEHKIRYPGYIYSPKEARMRKILRRVGVKHSRGGSLMSVARGPNSTLRDALQPVPPLRGQDEM